MPTRARACDRRQTPPLGHGLHGLIVMCGELRRKAVLCVLTGNCVIELHSSSALIYLHPRTHRCSTRPRRRAPQWRAPRGRRRNWEPALVLGVDRETASMICQGVESFTTQTCTEAGIPVMRLPREYIRMVAARMSRFPMRSARKPATIPPVGRCVYVRVSGLCVDWAGAQMM